jgi:very-short-patch-repair endonuclease
MSALEAAFLHHWRVVSQGTGAPWPEVEYQFDVSDSGRRWRFDFAWPSQWVAVECEGGVFTRGAHARISGILRDIEKYNAAQAQGWRVFRVTSSMLRDNPAGFVEMVIEALGWERSKRND